MVRRVMSTVKAALGPAEQHLTMTPRSGVEVFAVGIDWAQLIVRHDGRIESVVVEGLRPGALQEISAGGRGGGAVNVTTLTRPSGRLLARIATVSDLHLGEIAFGHFPRVRSTRREAEWRTAHPVRNAKAALEEIDAWAPDLLVVKGDITNDDLAHQYKFAIPLLTADGTRNVAALTGNHDGGNHSNSATEVEMARFGLPPDRGVTARVVGAGAHVVTVETVIPTEHKGTVGDRHHAVAAALQSGAAPALVLLHHQLVGHALQLYLPRGIPYNETVPFLDSIAAANPRTLVSSGHTHRHRRHQHGSVEVTEVGSTKDFPGTWAAYEIYENGIVQTVRRIADPAALAWGEHVRRTVFGVWGRWAPGTLHDRCFSRTWSTP